MRGEALLESAFLRRLEALTVVVSGPGRSRFSGRLRGMTANPGAEFVDYRPYQPGDDPRSIDWNIYGRLGQLLVRLARSDARANLHILLDVSRSMDFGRTNKLQFARRLALAFSFLALRNRDRVGLVTFSDRLNGHMTPRRGKSHFLQVIELLENVEPDGRTDLNAALQTYSQVTARPGPVVVISDFFDKHGFRTGLGSLARRKFEVIAIQVIDPTELDPVVAPGMSLRDAEPGAAGQVISDPAAVDSYLLNLKRYQKALEQFCLEESIRFVQLVTSTPFEQMVSQLFRAGIWSRKCNS